MTGAIPKTFVVETCKMGQMAACCRYLAVGKNGFCCLKHGEHHAYLDRRVENEDMNARGDNCVGWDRLELSPEQGPQVAQ